MAVSQRKSVTEQLDLGIRFLDFRIMFTSGDWHCLHFVQSEQPALVYLREIRQWMNKHPEEIIFIWFSKHGNQEKTGNEQYPGVKHSQKLAFWHEVENLFSGLLYDARIPLNSTTYGEAIKKTQRVVFFLSDYVDFSDSSKFAFDARLYLDNPLLISSLHSENFEADCRVFQNAGNKKLGDAKEGRFYLMSLACAPPDGGIEEAALLEFLPRIEVMHHRKECANAYHIPNFTRWCPETLLDTSQLNSFYKQRLLDRAYLEGWDFPNAIYLDVLDDDGTIRTGRTRLGTEDRDHKPCNEFFWTECADEEEKASSSSEICSGKEGYSSNGIRSSLE